MIEPCIRARLAADATLALLLVSGTGDQQQVRIFALDLPEGSVRPAITYRVISEIEDKVLEGAYGYYQVRLELNCWADTYPEARALGRAVKASLDDYSGRLASASYALDVQLVELDDSTGPHFDSTVRSFYVQQDWMIHFSA